MRFLLVLILSNLVKFVIYYDFLKLSLSDWNSGRWQFIDWNVLLCIVALLCVLALDQNMKKLDNLQNCILQLESGNLEVGSSSYGTPKS